MSYCVNCGTQLQDGFEFCPECGQAVSKRLEGTYVNQFRVCPRCGKAMPKDAFYCLACGTTFDDQQLDFDVIKSRVDYLWEIQQGANKNKEKAGIWKSKWIAFTLCVFFGMFGVHRFYERKIFTGIIYLLTFGIFGLGVIFDVFRLITRPNPYRVK